MTESTPAEVLERLREHRFFNGLDEKFLARLSEKAYERSYDPGVLLVREGDTAEEFFAILSGKVALSEGLWRSIPFDERGTFKLQ